MSAALRVGITGGIGSGKSAVVDRLAGFGIPVIDADVLARDVVAPGEPALAAIAAHFGAELLLEDGSLDRPALRRLVFSDSTQRRWLEDLTHPLIAKRIATGMEAADAPYVVLVSPLLLEASQAAHVDCVVVVDVPEALQLERTMNRDANSAKLVQSIMDAQLSRAERRARADLIIDNSGDLRALDDQVESLHRKLLTMAREAED